MTERDEYTAEGLLPNLAGHKALQIKKLEERARIAEQREAELVECLKEIHSLAFGDIAHDLEPEDALESIRVLAWREIAKHAKHKAEGRENDNDER